jgi:TetR/AcrR family transcriptional repressor of nem operon
MRDVEPDGKAVLSFGRGGRREMARPREFDEDAALDAAVRCFWLHGYEATSVRDLATSMGITGASLYNAFGDKRSLHQMAFDRYVDRSIADRIRRCETLAPRAAIDAFFGEILTRSLGDPECKGCMLVNTALDVTPNDPELRAAVAGVLVRIEMFFLGRVRAGQFDGSIAGALPANDLARHLLGALMGVRVLARVRPERDLLEGIVRSATALLDSASPRSGSSV